MIKAGCARIYLVLLLTAAGILLSSAVIPEYIHVCRASDPNIASCINNSVNHLRPRLKSGIPELDVPPMEPLRLDEIKLKRGPAAAAIDCNITNLQVWGPASFVVTELKPNLNKNKFTFKIWLPRLHFTGDYQLDMNILLISARGKGPIEGNFTNYRSDVVMKGRKIEKGGEQYLKFDKIHLRLQIGKSKIHLGNLFDKDPILRQVSEAILSENSDIFINEIKPALEHALAEKLTDIANKITLRFTYKELFS